MDWIISILGYFALSVLIPLALIGGVSVFTMRSAGDTGSLRQVALLLLGVAIIGACAGFAGGMSRVGVVGAIIPAMFTLLGGLAVYIFGVDTSKGVIASLTSGCLALAMFISYAFGSQLRNTGDEARDLRRICTTAYLDKDIIGDAQTLAEFDKRMAGWCKAGLGWSLAR